MKIALDISPLNNSSGVRGIGSYTQNLLNSLKKYTDIEISTFSSNNIPVADLLHYPYFDFFFHTLSIKKTKPRVVTIHDTIPIIFKQHYPAGIKGKYNLLLQKLALKNTNAVICDSYSSKKDIGKLLGFPPDKTNVVYLAPSPVYKPIQNIKALENTRTKYTLPENYFLFVGDINWNKNILGLLSAVKETGINIVMVGKALSEIGLSQVREINSEINRLNIHKHVIKTGYVSEKVLCAIYNMATATIVPSFYEGFGLPVLESMACGTPVLCSFNSSLTEIGQNTAIYFDPNKKKDISETINQYLSLTSDEKKKLAEKSLKHAANYTWEIVAKQTFDVYKNILNK